MTQEEINQLVAEWLAEELASDAAARSNIDFAADWVRPGEDAGAKAAHLFRWDAEESLFEWQAIVERYKWEQGETTANVLLKRHGVALPRDSQPYKLLCMAVCIATAELHGIRVERSLGHWGAEPELFPLAAGASRRVQPTPRTEPEPTLHLKDAIRQFLDEKRRVGGLLPKRLMDFEAAMNLLLRHLDNDKPVGGVAKSDIGAIRILLTKLPPNFTKRFPGRSLEEIAALAEESGLRPLNSTTINHKYLAIFDELFGWCHTCGYIAENPASGVRVKAAATRSEAGRGTFTVDELRSMFTAPLFSGCESDGRIYRPGTFQVRDHRYWLPLLALYSGARLGELCQLFVADICEQEGVWCINVSQEEGKRVKSEAGRRKIPLHPELQCLGFLSYVAMQRGRGEKRLFPEIVAGSGGYMSENPSKWFRRFLSRTLGEELVRRRQLAFHSFRHTMKDALRAAGVDERVQDAILGHENDHVSAAYGEGYKPPRLLSELSKIEYEGVDISSLYPNGERI